MLLYYTDTLGFIKKSQYRVLNNSSASAPFIYKFTRWFIDSKTSGQVLRSTRPSNEQVMGALSPMLKRPGGEVDQYPPSRTKNISHVTLWLERGQIYTFYVFRISQQVKLYEENQQMHL